MAVSQSVITTPVVTATGTLKRTVHDEIRRFNRNITPILGLVKAGKVNAMGEMSYSSGLISKEATPTMKFEWYTYTPISLFNTATGGTSGATGTFTVADNTAWRPRDIVTNLTSSFVVGIVTAVNADGVTVSVTKVGDDNWACVSGDVLCMSCRTMEEGTSDITPLTKEPDNNYNFVFPFRYAVSIADTAINSPHFTEQPLVRYMKDNMTHCLANMENAILFGRRAASGDTTSVTITTAMNMYTTRGILNFAQNTIDGSNMTWDKWTSLMIEQLPPYLNPEVPIIALMGRKSFGKLQGWANQKLMYLESGSKDEFGVVVKKFLCGPYTIIPTMHASYDQGGTGNPLTNTLTMFPADDLTYMYKTDMDIDTKDNLQLPATWGTTRAIQGVFGLRSLSGGQVITNVTNFS